MGPLKIQLKTPINSVQLINGCPADRPRENAGQSEELNRKLKTAASLCTALQDAVTQVEQLRRDIFVSHREQIVRLSVEIAAKILAKDIHRRNYDIENIVLSALQNIPTAQRFTIRLNPDDLALWQEAVKKGTMTATDHILCIGDAALQRAECIVETDQGVVEYLIEEQLTQVAAALLGTETCVGTAS